jgi:hypothetical protein
MQARSYRTVDKSAWGPGPWQDECDKLQWPDEETGLPCLIVRNRFGALCGYVGVAEGHPWFRADYDIPEVDVHGGLTFAAPCSPNEDESSGICHVPDPGEPEHVWWFGFDCAHANDLCPGMLARECALGLSTRGSEEDEYRDMTYVRAECARLAKQLAHALTLRPH